MRLHACPANIEDPNSHFTILMLLRLTYGDVMASCILELVMKEVLDPSALLSWPQDYAEYASPTKLVGEFSDKARRKKPANLFPFPKS